MSSTTFGPVFSVGASRHLYEILDTEVEGAGATVLVWVAAPAPRKSVAVLYIRYL